MSGKGSTLEQIIVMRILCNHCYTYYRLAETSMVMGPPAKKTKKLMKKGEEIIMIPVAAEDFKKLNEFAEAAMVVRHPEKASEIKEMRRKLLQQVMTHSTIVMRK